jgi:predicted RNA-binding protein with RPS1 domain
LEEQIQKILSIDRLEVIIQLTIKDLERRKDKAMHREETDNLWTKIESLQRVLHAIHAIRDRNIVLV